MYRVPGVSSVVQVQTGNILSVISWVIGAYFSRIF